MGGFWQSEPLLFPLTFSFIYFLGGKEMLTETEILRNYGLLQKNPHVPQ